MKYTLPYWYSILGALHFLTANKLMPDGDSLDQKIYSIVHLFKH